MLVRCQCVLVKRAIFMISGNESQPGLRPCELSLAERLQGRQDNPLARVTLAPRLGYPTCLVNMSCKKKKKYASARVRALLLG